MSLIPVWVQLCQPVRKPLHYLTPDHQIIASNTRCLSYNEDNLLVLGFNFRARQQDDKREMPDRLVPRLAEWMAAKYGADVLLLDCESNEMQELRRRKEEDLY